MNTTTTTSRTSTAAPGTACYHTLLDSPVGVLWATASDSGITGLHFAAGEHLEPGADWISDPEPFAELAGQLSEYFAGERRTFDIELDRHGTEFQMRVWSALAEIPYGSTATYGEIAAAVGRPTAVRAVGGANNANPTAIVVPCHRVIGADGSLTGFGGGLDAKSALLDLEARVVR